jgi:hypothetical protein
MSEDIEIISGRVFTPDTYINRTACDVLGRMHGQPFRRADMQTLLSQLSGFEQTPDFFERMVGGADHFLKRGVITSADTTSLRIRDVVYDPVGLIGLRFDNPNLQAVIIEPNDPGGNNIRMRLCVAGDWVMARPDPLDHSLQFGLPEVPIENSGTWKMMDAFGLPAVKTESALPGGSFRDLLKRIGGKLLHGG